jgi:8-oxo-dGTP diphosphatase
MQTRPEVRPTPGVSIAVFRAGDVLLVERGKEPRKGYWSLPGGHLEPGERVRDAALRELREETGVAAEIIGIADVVDAIVHAGDGALTHHYVLTVFAARWVSGEPHPASDSAAARFVAPGDLDRLLVTPGLAETVTKAAAQLSEPRIP